GRLGLVRTLHFPRAILPMSVTLTEFLASIPAFGLLFVLMFITGERPNWEWLLFPVAVIMQGVALVGFAFIAARLVNASQDMANLIPVVVRLLRYVSGVFFPVVHYAQAMPPVVQEVLTMQPFALMLTTGRQSLMGSESVVLTDWLAMAVWAVVVAAVGLIVFWRAETRYGRGRARGGRRPGRRRQPPERHLPGARLRAARRPEQPGRAPPPPPAAAPGPR